ncbi:MAG: C4-type zinc ribbon domain-containing protein [Chloroflexota bacterium]|nr:C4-type zinc ribbon domain-containing protein [Chloroflexota bacterium]
MLYELQDHDLEIEAKRQSLLQVEACMGESNAIIDARTALAREEERGEEMEHLRRRMEFDMEDLQGKVAAAEGKLYGGTVRSSKELLSLKEQSESYRRKIGEIEERILDLMADIEDSENKTSLKREQIAQMEEDWRKEQGSLAGQREDLVAAIAKMELERNERAARIDKASLDLYEHLRRIRQGRAVAKIEQGMCQGCRIVLPTNKLQQVKADHDLVQCGSCERILYLS